MSETKNIELGRPSSDTGKIITSNKKQTETKKESEKTEKKTK